MAHSIIARHYKIPVASITLFVFGGIARISRDPSRAIEEFNIAVAGPISSLLLAGILDCACGIGIERDTQDFDCVVGRDQFQFGSLQSGSGFPLDGGRVFEPLCGASQKIIPSRRVLRLAPAKPWQSE